MKQEVTYSCGHTGWADIYGNRAHKERMLYAIENYSLCPECEAKKRAEDSAKAADEAKEKGLPALSGSEKQIAWAETLRQKAWDAVQNCLQMYYMYDKRKANPDLAEDVQLLDGAVDWYFGHTESRWYINNRNWPDKIFRDRVAELIAEAKSKKASGQEAPSH